MSEELKAVTRVDPDTEARAIFRAEQVMSSGVEPYSTEIAQRIRDEQFARGYEIPNDELMSLWAFALGYVDASSAADAELARLREAKDGAYSERNKLVAALTKCFPSWLARHPDTDKEWEDDWRWIVFVQLPTGQATWHIHDSERAAFDHLKVGDNVWDGHDTDEKYARLAALASQAGEKGEGDAI